jgi:hypothetical protein
MSKCRKGWGYLSNSPKWHYFDEDGRSLCGRYARFDGNMHSEDFNDTSSDNCAACRKKLAKIRPLRDARGQDIKEEGE